MMGFTLLQAMTSLEQNFANVTTPYLMILGSEDKICNIQGSKVSKIFLEMGGSVTHITSTM